MNQLQPFQQALQHLTAELIRFLPNLITGLLMLAAGWLLGKLLAGAARQLARRLRLDAVMESAGWADALSRAEIKARPSDLVGRLVFWVVFLCFVVLAIENFGLGLTAVPLRTFVGYLPRLLGAVLLLFVGSLAAVLVGKAIDASLARIDFAQHKLLAGFVRGLILVVTLVETIEHLGFEISLFTATLTNLVTIVAAGLAITFALGGREVTRNMLAGYYAREKFRIGDRLALPEGQGELISIGTVSSEIELDDGNLVVPNHRLLESAVKRLPDSPGLA